MRMYVSLKSDRYGGTGGGYRVVTDVLSDAQLRRELLQQAFDEFQAWQQKYQHLKALAPIFEGAAKVAVKINGTKTPKKKTKVTT